MQRRDLMWLAGLAAPGLCLSLPALAVERELRIGIQKYGSLVVLKERGLLEQRLGPHGWTVTWTEFPGGPQLLEALNVGAIDFGTTGEAPPIFAQAAGAPLLYVGYEPPAPQGEAILVPKEPPIADVAGLKGKKVAFNKGSNVQYLLVKALEAAGLTYAEIEPVYLPPADARAAFDRGAIDAWVIWDPFLRRSPSPPAVRVPCATATGLVKNHHLLPRDPAVARRDSAGDRIGGVPASRDSIAGPAGNVAEARHDPRARAGVDPSSRARAWHFDRSGWASSRSRLRWSPSSSGSPTSSTRSASCRSGSRSPKRSRTRASDRAAGPPPCCLAGAARVASLPGGSGARAIRRRVVHSDPGDGRHLGTTDGARTVDLDYLRQIAQAADRLGYYGVLLPTGRSCEDTWVVASALVPLTQRLRFLVAVRPGLSRLGGGAHGGDLGPPLGEGAR